MVRRRDLKLVTDTKVIPSESVAPQHRLLVMDTKIAKPKSPKCRTGPKRIKWWKWKEYKKRLLAALKSISVDHNQPIEDMWVEMVKHVQEVVEEVFGSTKPGRRYIDKQVWWWNEEVQEEIKAKKLAFKTWWHMRMPEDINVDTNHIVQVRRNPKDILQRWSTYFAGIGNDDYSHQSNNSHPPIVHADPVTGPVKPITTVEVQNALKKNRKATRPDDIPAEVWKLMDEGRVAFLTALFNRIVA
ncbi:hypothetical protein SRHO_G00232630 [Serrasalmus rhombeus]